MTINFSILISTFYMKEHGWSGSSSWKQAVSNIGRHNELQSVDFFSCFSCFSCTLSPRCFFCHVKFCIFQFFSRLSLEAKLGFWFHSAKVVNLLFRITQPTSQKNSCLKNFFGKDIYHIALTFRNFAVNSPCSWCIVCSSLHWKDPCSPVCHQKIVKVCTRHQDFPGKLALAKKCRQAP